MSGTDNLVTTDDATDVVVADEAVKRRQSFTLYMIPNNAMDN